MCKISTSSVFWEDTQLPVEEVNITKISYRVASLPGETPLESVRRCLPQNLRERFWFRNWAGEIYLFVVRLEGEEVERKMWIDRRKMPEALRHFVTPYPSPI